MVAVAGEETEQGRTISDVWEACSKSAPGFDFMRIALAIAVLISHSFNTTMPDAAIKSFMAGPANGMVTFILPMFFCLSGFLVTSSLERVCSVWVFAGHRAIRIIPALAAEVLLSAFILGPLVTTVPLQAYFTDPHFYSYIGNVIGRIRFVLPGVFTNNPMPNTVNLSLWTVPYELDCYVVLLVLIATTAIRSRKFILLLVFGLAGLKFVLPFFVDPLSFIGGYVIEQPGNPYSGYTLVLSFLVGVSAFLWRDKIYLKAWAASLCAVAFVFLSQSRLTAPIVPFVLGYLTVYIGMTHMPKLPFFSTGDYSYGVYLYAFPIQQTFAYAFPHLRIWWLSAAFTIVAATAVASASWHLIERPSLKLRRRFTGDGLFAFKVVRPVLR